MSCWDSVENKVLEFFSRNPDEQLTADDVAQKFGVEKSSACRVVKSMFDRNLLNRTRENAESGRRHWVYEMAKAAHV